MTTADDRLYSRTPDVPVAEFDDELAVMNLSSGAYVTFNRTAAAVWKLLDQPRSLSMLCEILAERYGIAPADCRADVEALLERLQSMQLVR